MILEAFSFAALVGLGSKYLDNKTNKMRSIRLSPPLSPEIKDRSKLALVIPIPFKPGEPKSFDEFQAQEATLELLKDAINGMDDDTIAIRPQMFTGVAGGGKTLLAKVVAQELRHRTGVTHFIEAMDIKTEEGLDAIMSRVMQYPGSTVFFDEIHVLANYNHLMKLYLALDENRYHFKDAISPVVLPPTTFLSSTTNYGALPEAFKRRWVIHFFESYTREQLGRIIRNRGVPIYDDAAELVLARTAFGGTPWEPVQLVDLANNARKARKGRKINTRDVKRVFRLYQIDRNGLRKLDRAAIAALFRLIKRKVDGEMHYAGSEENVALMSKIDRDEFKSSVRPRLIARGLLELRPWWGHCLTDRAVEMYDHLREENV